MPRIPSSILRRGLRGAAVKPIGLEAPAPLIPESAAQIPGDAPAPSPVAQVQEQTVAAVVDTAKVEQQAETLTKANLGDYDLGADWMPNFERINTTDDIKAVIADTAQRNAPKIQEARRGKIANEQLAGMAADLDIPTDVIRPVMEREAGGVLSPEVILASRQVLNSSADRLLQLAKKVRDGGATDLDRVAFRRQFEFHAEYQRQFMGARAETGRALNAFAIPVGSDANQIARLKHVVETMNGHDTDQLATMLGQADNLQGINKLTREYTQSRILGVTQELFVNSILSGIKTHVVNATGNVLFQGMNIAETAVAARLGRFLSGDEHVQIGEASALVYGAISGWRDALRAAGKALNTGEPLDAAMKYETPTRRAISSRNLLPANAPPGLARAVDALGTVIRLPTERVMLPIDEFFKTIAQRSELARQAYLHAGRQAAAQPMTNDQIAETVRQFIENPPREAMESAGDMSRYVTFQTPLGPTGAQMTRTINMIPGGRLIAPFIQTPLNLLKAGLFERSPLAVFSADFRAAMKEGGPRRDLALARVSMGSLTVGSVALAASSGAVTGGGPQDPAARKVLEATGWQPYSVVVADPISGETHYQSYSRAEPLAYVIGATADAVEMLAYIDYDDELRTDQEQMNNLVASVVAGVANNTMSKTFMQGVMDFSEMLSDPKRYASGWINNMVGAMVPFSSLRRDLSRIQDPYVREAWTLSEKMKASSGIPGYSSDAPPRRDLFGEPIRHKGGSLLGILSPFPDSQAKNDATLNEIVRVMQTTRQVPITMPGRRVEGMLLSVDEYDQLIRYSRSEDIFNGKTFKGHLAELTESPIYGLATDDYKRVLIKQVQEQADKIGRTLLEQRDVVYADRIQEHRRKKQLRMFGEALAE